MIIGLLIILEANESFLSEVWNENFNYTQLSSAPDRQIIRGCIRITINYRPASLLYRTIERSLT